METPMHAPYDRSRSSNDRTEPKSGAGFLIVPVLIVLALIGLTVFHPKASLWISQAVQAEFIGDSNLNEAPTRIVQPGMELPMRTVHAD
jgi:hypothetical protein